MNNSRFLREVLFASLVALICTGCSSRPEPEGDNDFKQSSFSFHPYKSQKSNLIDKLQEQNIQFVQYGDTKTLIVPTDQQFTQGTTDLKNRDYGGLNNIVKLIKLKPATRIYVAAFSDNSGSANSRKDMTQALAEKISTFLWANGIPATQLNAQGYGDKFSVGNNRHIHSSAYNRRVEIQWTDAPKDCCVDIQKKSLSSPQ